MTRDDVRSTPEHRTGVQLTELLAPFVASLCGIAGAFAFVRFFAAHVGHDQAWGLYLGMQVLDGVKLNGPYLVEVNPPFLVWFMSLPVLFSRAVHLDVLAGFRYFLVGLGTLTVVWSVALFRRLERPAALRLWLFILLQIGVCSLAVRTLDLGQREYFVSFFLIPYLLLAAFRVERRSVSVAEACAVGLLACVAVCLKPQHILDLGVVELLILVRVRRLREWVHPAWISLGVGLGVYFLLVRVLAPDYLTDLVPLLKETYWGFSESLRTVLHSAMIALPLGFLTVGLYLGLRRRLKDEPLISVLLAASVGAALAYLQQHKGWPYQLLCFQVFCSLAFGLICMDLLERWIGTRVSAVPFKLSPSGCILLSLGCFVVAVLPLTRYRHQELYPEPLKQTLATLFSAYPKGSAVTFLSTAPYEFPALVEQQKVLGTRYLHLWLLPSILRSYCAADSERKNHLSAAEIVRLSTLLRTEEAEDLAHFRPVVVVLQPYAMPAYCTPAERTHYGAMLDWFLAEPRFREQWSHYRYQKSVDGLDVFTRND